MKKDKNSRYEYSQAESEAMKAMQMQRRQLASETERSAEQAERLKDIRERAERLGGKLGAVVAPKAKDEDVPHQSLQISRNEIPTWEELAARANREVSEEVILEDLLNREEFNYCIEDMERINSEFARSASIFNLRDLAFLNLAVFLQTARWLILQEYLGDVAFGQSRPVYIGRNYPSWQEILAGHFLGQSMSASLGNHPILGWIFGTANLMTRSATVKDGSKISNYKLKYPKGTLAEKYPHAEMFADVLNSTKEDKMRLVAALFAQGKSMRSNKGEMAVPYADSFSDVLAGKLYDEQFAMLGLVSGFNTKAGMQAGFSILVNMIIGVLHKMMYDKEKDGDSMELYEARTRQILLVSNQFASAGNIVYCIYSEDWKKLDVGGLLVSLQRMCSDAGFITKIRERYVQQHLDQVIAKDVAAIDANFTEMSNFSLKSKD